MLYHIIIALGVFSQTSQTMAEPPRGSCVFSADANIIYHDNILIHTCVYIYIYVFFLRDQWDQQWSKQRV